MKNTRSTMIFIMTIIAFFTIFDVTHAEIYNRVVAIVDEEVITLHELNDKMKEMTGMSDQEMRTKDMEKYIETRKKVLEYLIDEKITQKKIRELKIEISQEQIDNAVENIKRNNQLTQEDLLGELKKEGLTYEKFREGIRKDIERATLINYEVRSKIIIREEQTVSYYEENKDQFITEGKVHLACIFLIPANQSDEDENSELAQIGHDIIMKIKSGEEFGEMAKKFSRGPGSAEGGDVGWYKLDQLDKQLMVTINGLSEGEVSDLIKRDKGYQIVKLIKKEEKKTKSYEEAKDAIYDILFKNEINKRYDSWIKNLRANTYIKIMF